MKQLLIIVAIATLSITGCSKKVKKDLPLASGDAFEVSYFNYDSSNLNSRAKEILRANAKSLKDHPEMAIQIEGHCDERGSEQYNLALGERRAESVRTFLISLGVSPTRLTTISMGEASAIIEGSTEEAWSKNRRAEFVITTQISSL